MSQLIAIVLAFVVLLEISGAVPVFKLRTRRSYEYNNGYGGYSDGDSAYRYGHGAITIGSDERDASVHNDCNSDGDGRNSYNGSRELAYMSERQGRRANEHHQKISTRSLAQSPAAAATFSKTDVI